jgi:alkylation response protein AidB-like acyl-CoA dehydrogenase
VGVAVHTSVASLPILWFGDDEQKRRLLPGLASGKTIGAFAVTEPQSGSDLASIQTTAQRKGDKYVLNGSKVFITNGSVADRVIVAARAPGTQGPQGISVFAVDAHAPGFQRGRTEEKMGLRSSDTAGISFQDLEVPAADRLGPEGEGFPMLMKILNSSRLSIAAQAIGMSRRAHDESVAYAKQRKAFGSPISKHQAVQFMLADMATRIDAARLMTYKAAADEDRGDLKRDAASMAKLLASETCVWVAEQAVQIHGGNGYIKDYVVERILRDAPVTRIYEGTSEIQKLVIGRAIQSR